MIPYDILAQQMAEHIHSLLTN